MNFKGHSIFKVVRFFKPTLLFVLLTGALPSFAQLNPGNLKQYTELDGLPASEVGSILPDRNGYIWVGTLNGLARYDGYEFKRFFNNPNDPGSIQGLQVWSLFEDSQGQIWVPTSPTNLNVYNPITQSFKKYDYKHLIDHPANVELGINAICSDQKGRIYFGVNTNFGEDIYNGILYKDEGDSSVHLFATPDSSISQNVIRMTSDPDGTIWIITYSGLFKIDTLHQWTKLTQWQKILEKNGDFPSDLKPGDDGALWIITAKGLLYEFNVKSDKYNRYNFANSVELISHKIALDGRGKIWIGSEQGLSQFNLSSKDFTKFYYETSHPMDRAQVRAIKPDKFGNIWIGTQQSGLFKYEEKAIFKTFSYKKDQKAGLAYGWANNCLEAKDGSIYISTSGPRMTGGISIMDPKSQTIISTISYDQLTTPEILSLIEFSPNEFYMCTWQGVYQFSPSKLPAKKIKFEGIPDQILVQRIIEDKKGNFWYGTTNGLFRKSKNSAGMIKYDLSLIRDSDANSNEVTNFFESPVHGLWLLTNNGLFLYRYEKDSIERHAYDRAKGDILITQDINSFYEDTSGLAWIGTWQGGLSAYNLKTRKILTYSMDDGLPSMSIQGILPDEKNGALWLSTFDGLSRFDLKEMRFNNYSISDGIQGQLFADGSSLKTSGGLFIFGGSNGITLFNPDLINKSSQSPGVFLTNFKLFDQSILPGENSILKKSIQETNEIILKNNQNNITLEFAAIHYSNPSKNRTIYRLEGFENEWRDAGNQQLAFYPNLPPGQYTFRVKAANNNGVWNETGAVLKITILPPWWKTTWAYLGYFLILVAGGFTLDKYLRHRIVEKERERFQAKQLEQAKEIEKAYLDLGQAHETLKATQAQLIQSEKMASLGELTAGIAHEIQNPLNFVNNFSEINIELLEELSGQRSRVKGERNEQVETELLKDIEENEEKINHHGKRADAIVKAMLQHSQKSSGVKEPTNINTLAQEYYRLAYNSYKSKENLLTEIKLITDLDANLPLANVIPHDLGRVFLNLYNNAIWACIVKSKDDSESPLDLRNYIPTIKLTTKKIVDKIEIRLHDNGPGIPPTTIDKIFQPFFTTKPTGQGTGLGLSLAYDIVTKGHHGTLKVSSQAGQGTEFIVQLPV